MRARRLGQSSVELSRLAFGTMRLDERRLDERACEHLINDSLARGITTFHSSIEYESFPRFCAILRRLGVRGREIQNVVKLAEPHFGDTSFDESRLREKVEAYLTKLGARRIDVVQWMWRGDLKDEEARLAGFARQRDEMQAAFNALRKEGKIGAVATFPYTVGFANAVLSARFSDGLAVYLNPFEQEMLGHVDRAAAIGAGIVAIRPLAAGRAAEEGIDVATCIRDVFSKPAVSTAVVTYSSLGHMEELVRAADAAG